VYFGGCRKHAVKIKQHCLESLGYLAGGYVLQVSPCILFVLKPRFSPAYLDPINGENGIFDGPDQRQKALP
jgi:hypothetical protein